ncbi:MAG TPA: T9SS type A sorting domain-containing protein, partial [Bacteroidia bacterium]|nr:T9SS type A sorting domain-containing protein [Bacteroidia bacterium]
GPTNVLCGSANTYSISPRLPGCTYDWWYYGATTLSGTGTSFSINNTTSSSLTWVIYGPTGCEIDALQSITCSSNNPAPIKTKETYVVANTVNVYPNPAHASVNVHADLSPNEQLNMCIYNSIGETVKCETLTEDNSVVSTDMLSAGLYYYRITNTGGTIIKADKLMILR